MLHSIGKALPASTDTTLFTVPNGYVAHLSMTFISNTSGSTGTMTMYWQHAHDVSHKVYILNAKSLNSKDYIQFTGGIVVMKSGDSLVFNPSQPMDVIATFDLLQSPPLYTFSNE